MQLTKRNHYNPCFWTALWNEEYFAALVEGRGALPQSRKQRVYTLNVRAGKVFPTTVDNVHYEKNLGIAEMSPASIKDFCRRRFPRDYASVARYVDAHPDGLVMDFESILTGIDQTNSVDTLREAAKIGGFSSKEHRGMVACHLIVHAMRSHEFMTAMTSATAASGLEKWEYFWMLKNAWSSRLVLARAVAPLGLARWTLYRSERHRFPLCDSPVMINRDNVMMILSPRLRAEIDLTVPAAGEDDWLVRDVISGSKYREFRRRAIQNTFKDLIFSDPRELEEWRALPDFRKRMGRLNDPAHAKAAVSEAADRVVWALGGFGRVPDDFEDWIEPIIDAAVDQGGSNRLTEAM